jgi:transcriptional regulator with XRE-family HTH domain
VLAGVHRFEGDATETDVGAITDDQVQRRIDALAHHIVVARANTGWSLAQRRRGLARHSWTCSCSTVRAGRDRTSRPVTPALGTGTLRQTRSRRGTVLATVHTICVLHSMTTMLPSVQNVSVEASLADIGAALRRERLERGLTLEAVGARTGLSVGYISRIERGKATTLSTLISIANALGVSLQSIFAGPGDTRPLHEGYLLRRASDAGFLSGGVYRYQPVAGGLPQHSLWLFKLEYPPFSADDFDVYAHDGEEVLYVLQGEIEFSIGGDRITLRAGDCVQYDARQPHGGGNRSAEPATMLMAYTGQSDPHIMQNAKL